MLLSPLPDAPADAHALDFAWDHAAARLQVSETETFDTLVTDVPVAGLDTISLQGLLPANNRTYFWRVGDDGAWTAPSAFRAASDDDVFEWNKARDLAAHDVQMAALRTHGSVAGAPGMPAVAPWTNGETSKTEAVAFTYFMVASFVILLIVIFRSVA